jgi:hypothetical protein
MVTWLEIPVIEARVRAVALGAANNPRMAVPLTWKGLAPGVVRLVPLSKTSIADKMREEHGRMRAG